MAIKDFAVSEARPLPVILLLDTSGSMSENGKIEALNQAVKEMLDSFARESRLRAEIQVGLITFGDVARIHLPLAPANTIQGVTAMSAYGGTPMGAAFSLVCESIEDVALIPSRAYRPAIILVSDGQPTDDWEPQLERLKKSNRAQRASRYAMTIGPDADEQMLKRFINDPEAPVFRAAQARDISRFFRAVTMSIFARLASQNPEVAPPLQIPSAKDDLDLDF